jgi:hypothetical protein
MGAAGGVSMTRAVPPLRVPARAAPRHDLPTAGRRRPVPRLERSVWQRAQRSAPAAPLRMPSDGTDRPGFRSTCRRPRPLPVMSSRKRPPRPPAQTRPARSSTRTRTCCVGDPSKATRLNNCRGRSWRPPSGATRRVPSNLATPAFVATQYAPSRVVSRSVTQGSGSPSAVRYVTN